METRLKNPITFETTFATYRAESILAEGGSGRIYKAKDETNAACAIKTIKPEMATREKLKRFKNELTFSIQNAHPNIMTVIDHGSHFFEDKKVPFYVMPLLSGSLRMLMEKGINKEKILVYFCQLLDGVEAAHLKQVVHRDLKPENILYEESKDQLLISDFGIAQFSEEEIYTIVETGPATRLANFQYAAPEQRSRGQVIGPQADIFALGLILNELFTGEIPQGTEYKKIESIIPDYGYLDELTSLMIRQSPSDRPKSIEEIRRFLIVHIEYIKIPQQLDSIHETTVPISEIDDPIINDPIRIIAYDWDRGRLSLKLNQPVNNTWIWALRNMGSHSSLMGKGPEKFYFEQNNASINADDDEVQGIIDYFKLWLPQINRVYAERISDDRKAKEEIKRQEMKKEIEYQQKRRKLLSSVKI